MNRYIIPLLILFLMTCDQPERFWTNPNDPNWEIAIFKKIWRGGSNDYGNSVQQTTDGGYIITGITNSYGNGNADVWLIKTDFNGDSRWSKTFGGSNHDDGNSVQQTSDGGYIITGQTFSLGQSWIDSDVWLIKTDSEGNEEWNQTFGGGDRDDGNSVQQTTDGGYIITGETKSFGNGGSDVWLIKTDSQGNEEWNQTLGGSDTDIGYSGQQTLDGGYIITGETKSFGNGGSDVWLIKTDSQGNSEWSKTFGGDSKDAGYSVQQTTDNGYIITGETKSSRFDVSDVWLIKTYSQGAEEWNKTWSGSNYGYGHSVQETVDGGYIIIGYTQSQNSLKEVLLIKTDSNGDDLWMNTYDDGIGKSGQQTADGGFIITGDSNSLEGGGSDVWLIKTDPEGNAGP